MYVGFKVRLDHFWRKKTIRLPISEVVKRYQDDFCVRLVTVQTAVDDDVMFIQQHRVGPNFVIDKLCQLHESSDVMM